MMHPHPTTGCANKMIEMAREDQTERVWIVFMTFSRGNNTTRAINTNVNYLFQTMMKIVHCPFKELCVAS